MRCLSCYAEFSAVNQSTGKSYVRCERCRSIANQRSKISRIKNIEKCRATGRRHNRQRRLDVLELYGNRCVCCGETEEAFLALDHIKNDGSEHRKKRGHHGTYRDALEHDPERFQILCYNCNHVKATRGFCPHERVVH